MTELEPHPRYTTVRRHRRRNPVNPGTHIVRRHKRFLGYRDQGEVKLLQPTHIADIKGIGERTSNKLAKHGYVTLEDAQRLAEDEAMQQQLIKQERVHPSRMRQIVQVGKTLEAEEQAAEAALPTYLKIHKDKPETTYDLPRSVPVKIPKWGDSRYKQWTKIVADYNPKATGGWAFRGQWINPGYHRLVPGTLIMQYGEEGSRRYHKPHVRFSLVNDEGKLHEVETFKGSGWDIKNEKKIQMLVEEYSTPPWWNEGYTSTDKKFKTKSPVVPAEKKIPITKAERDAYTAALLKKLMRVEHQK